MSQLWPDAKTVLTAAPVKPVASSNSLWPDAVASIGKPTPPKPNLPAGTNYKDPVTGKLQTTHNPAADMAIPEPSWKDYLPTVNSTKQTASQVGNLAVELPKSLVTTFIKPSDTELQLEKTAAQGGKLNKIATTIVKPLTRFFEPIVEGFGTQAAQIIFDQKTATALANDKQIQTIGKQVQPQFLNNQETGNAKPADYFAAIMNSANVVVALAGAITDVLGIAGESLSTRGTSLKVTPEQISQVLKSDAPMPAEARMVLQKLSDNGQGFEMNLKRPAGGLRQTVGEALGGKAERATTFKSTGDVNPQLEGPQPFAHEAAAEPVQSLSPFQHEAPVRTPNTIANPFAHEDVISSPVEASPFAHEAAPVAAEAGSVASYINKDGQKVFTKITPHEFSVLQDEVKNIPSASKGNSQIHLDAITEQQQANSIEVGRQEFIDGHPQVAEMFSNVPKPESTTLTAELVPGLSKTIEEDIIPKAKGTAQRISDIYHEMANLINPTGAASKESLDIIMKAKGDFERKLFRTEQTQHEISKAWDKQPEDNRLAFMEKIENGMSVGPENKALADSYRERLNNAHLAISQYKDVPFLENFFPHFWERPNEVSKNFLARRPLEGNKSFLKHRIFRTIQEGIDAGYKPLTTNPEQLMQIYETNVAKFVMAQKMKADLMDNGMWKVVPNGASLEPGYSYIDDPIARVYFPQGEINTPTGPKKNFAQYGRAAVPTPVARLINNHLSTDLLNSSPTFKTFMAAKNSLNAIQLGFSGFHALFTTIDSTVTGIDVGLSKLARGDFAGAAKEFVKAPFNAVSFFRDGQKFYNGNPELLKIEEDLFHGGASLREKQYYKNQVFEKFIANIRGGNYIGALGRLPMAAIEGTMRPLFSYYIPRLKVGAFRELFSEEITRKAADIASGKTTRATIAREVWGNIENRLGELNYDNLFWNRNFKAANMGMWRAVGFNLGTIREIGGATTQDLYRFVREASKGQKPDLTPKMRYTIALLFTMGAIGSIYEYLHTGHGPKSLTDMFYPENGATDVNGDPVRVQMPSYLKDMYAYAHHPLETIGHKMSPEVSLIIDILQNKDYYNNYVYDPKSGVPQKIGESLQYVIKQIKPFSLTNVFELQKGKASASQQAESFLGIQKAPSDIIQSDRTKAIFDNLSTAGPKTPEEQRLSKLKNDYRKKIQSGQIPSFTELKNAGLVTSMQGYKAFLKAAKLTPVERAYKTLPKAVKKDIPN